MCFAHCAEEPDPFFQCPRFALARLLERIEEELSGVDVLFGCETEFIVLDLSLQALQSPDNVVGWCTMTGLRDRKLEMVEDVVRMLQKSDIGVTHFHCEEPQQLELSTYPFPPMQAVDNLYYTQECLRVIALRHGYRATVAIKPLPPPHETTSTVGLHFSLSGIATAEHDHFLAGVLKQLPVITPFAMPTHDSYHRTSVDRYGTWICWGTENRDVAIRKIKAGHWELRLCDATANFFLLGTILLSVGLDGVSAKQILSMRDLRSPSTQVSSEVLEAHGINKRLPSSFRDSLEFVRKSDYIENLLGHEMKSLWLTTKELDEDALCRMSDEERRKAYLQHF
jgi:glutamine synthetase